MYIKNRYRKKECKSYLGTKGFIFLIKHICGYNKIGSKGKFQGEDMILSLKFCPLVWVGN